MNQETIGAMRGLADLVPLLVTLIYSTGVRASGIGKVLWSNGLE